MMDRLKEFIGKYKRLILIIIGILLIAIIAFFSIPRASKNQPVLTPESTIPGNELVQPASTAPVEPTSEQKSESNALAVASSFVEIYGTYSNQSNYTNIENVLSLASSEYRQELLLTLNDFRVSYKPGAVYEGTTTIIVNKITEELSEAAGTATIFVKTQRKISKGTQSNYTIQYQDIRLDLVREGDSWLVDSAKWIQ